MSAKYFVYGGGRWREVDLKSGCVSGWGRVQWVSLRRGRLAAARRGRVLRALAALAANRPARAADGPRLSVYSELEEKPVQKQQKAIHSHRSHSHCCCGHGPRCENPADYHPPVSMPHPYMKIDVATQAETISTCIVTEAQIHHTRKRKYSSSSSDSNCPKNKKVLEHKIVRRHSDDSSISTISKMKDLNVPTKELIINEDDVLLLRSCIERNILFPEADLLQFDLRDDYKTLIFYRLNPLVHIERSSQITRMLRQTRDGSQNDNVTFDEFVTQLGLQSVKDIKQTRRYKTRNKILSDKTEQMTESKISTSTTSEDVNLQELSQSKLDNKPTSRPSKRKNYQSSSSGSNTETDKENINHKKANNAKPTLQEALHTLRKKNGQFKSANKKRSERRETKAYGNSNKKPKLWSNDVSNRPKLRDRSIVISSDSDNDHSITNENSGRRVSKRLSSAKNIEGTENKTVESVNKKVDSVNKKVETGNKNEETNKNEDSENKKPVGLFFKKRSGSPPKKVLASKIRARNPPKSADGRGYSLAEDAAIVRWLRRDELRPRRVNGNQLWRQLEKEYPALVNRHRSWHSLRNRYLRGVLPALHRLPLSAAAAAQLRAAAANGELKSRSEPSRRHPLFPAPQRGASSRTHTRSASSSPPQTRRSLRVSQPPDQAPDPPPNQTPDSTPVQPMKSALKKDHSPPTYSELTRRFALRVRPSSTPSNSTESSPNKSVRFDDGVTKSRRLYNPK